MVTIKDVAADANVAVGTVSKVINGRYVSEKNRIKVEESIKKLGYEINYYAKGLKMQRTYTVAVIVPEILNPFFAAWVYHIEQALYKSGYKMVLCNTLGTNEKEKYYFKMASQNKVDGIICVSYSDIESYVSENVPIISLDRHFEKRISCISSDNYHGGELAAEKMISTGSHNLLYIQSGSKLPGETMKREYGFRDYCGKNDIPCDVFYLGEEIGVFEDREACLSDNIYKFISENTLSGKFKYDGVYVSTDWLALIVLKNMRKIGIKIPEDTQVIGHDGLRWMNYGSYMLSTIKQPVQQMAEKSVELIKKKIDGKEIDILTVLPVEFVDGGTTR